MAEDKAKTVEVKIVPETPEEMQEFLADDKRSAQVFGDPELRAEFLKNYVRNVNKARPDIQRMIDDGVQKGMKQFMIENGV